MELKIQDLCKSYGKKKALWNFTTEFENGIYGILGPNGAGKSTLMNILTDNLLRDSGSVLYDGEEILNLGASYREIMGYMPQQQQLYDTFTVTHFISYMGTLKGMKSRDIQGRMDELLPLLNLQKVRKKKLKELSGGMKQRVLLLQALLNDPKFLILDEPTAGLDKHFREKFLKICTELVADGEKSILIATHITEELDRIADYIAYMQNGRMLFYTESYKMCERFRIVTGEDYKCNLIPDEAVVYKEKNAYSTSAMVVNSEWYKIDDELEKHIPDIREFMYYFVKGGEKNAEVIAEKYLNK